MALKSSFSTNMRGQGLALLLACQLCAVAAYTSEASAGAFDQLQSMTGGSGYIPPVSGPECVSGCGGSDSQGGGDSDNYEGRRGIWGAIDRWQEQREEAQRQEAQRQQQEERQKKQEAFNLNEQGNRAFEKSDWATAVDLYRSAVSKSPNDKVIQENLRRAERELQRLEELRREQSEYRKRMGQLVTVMPAAKPLSKTVKAPQPVVPLPGFSQDQWKEYLAAQDTVARLYAQLNRDGVLSDADAATFYSALRKRNELWTMAAGQPLADDERDTLRLPLPRIVSKTLLSSVMGMVQQGGSSGTSPSPAIKSPDRRLASASNPQSSANDSISTAFAADFFADKITGVLESETGDAIEKVHGEKFKGNYEKMLAVGRIAVAALEGGAPAAGAETVDFLISKIPEPVGPHAGFAVEGGRMYSKVAYQALNRFMVDAAEATGTSFDSEAFWKRFNDELTASQKGVKAWIEFGE
ncbi:hypothetical protein KI811_01985 [Geobacter hydrogenophilus]|uniref:TPR repeat-containing protein n=1 Tax=Geobacter hydrogenophilus TaxID=40983 RepID=A0A9W6LEF3_9BACT|nr:hypothetical protein [Geobacter hydrogenophilus]MBT0892592.1 hypothetical protein [Geobacter hydrogenophilus]GLI39990.1 hypothetical protein GHYDROH2_34910 [Geobacter hydrogenophilus]